MLALLRLAVTLFRARSDSDFADFRLTAKSGNILRLQLPPGWLDSHPLTSHDLRAEGRHLARLGLTLKLGTL